MSSAAALSTATLFLSSSSPLTTPLSLSFPTTNLLFSKLNPSPRFRISCKATPFSNQRLRTSLPRICCSYAEDSDHNPEPYPAESSIDLKLPRRRLLVQFTCDACGERTKRVINRLAYERGTVFVQCAGCLQHHKLVDNLGLVVEYDFREDNS